MRLVGKVGFVTGAGRGIGKAIALAFAHEGAAVAVNDIDGETGREVAGQIENAGGKALFVQGDVRCGESVRVMVERVVAHFGRIDILVNNAGVAVSGPTHELSEEDWNRCLDTNLKAVFLVCRAVAKVMIAQRSGRIINISSIAGRCGLPERAAYCASKAAVDMFTKVVALEWGKYGIKVNAIAPGYTKTEMVYAQIRRGVYDEQRLASRTALGRMGEPEDVARVAVFLACDESDYITGETIMVDGGWSAYGYL